MAESSPPASGAPARRPSARETSRVAGASLPRPSFAESATRSPLRPPAPGPAEHAADPSPSHSEALDWLRGWTRRECGIDFSDEQSGLFNVRVESLSRELSVDVEQLRARVERGDRSLTLRLNEAVSTNYTFFFREPEMFELLAQRVLPELPRGEPLRFWSAACSSGDEAYSLAIFAREQLADDAACVRILGTDLSDRQVRAAEAGVYRGEQLALVDKQRLARWFRPLANHYCVADELRSTCTFRRMNLLRYPWPFGQKFHLVFLRNVLYYFEPSKRRELLEQCYDAVEPGGYLVTSLTEPMMDMRTRWQPIAPALYRRGARP